MLSTAVWATLPLCKGSCCQVHTHTHCFSLNFHFYWWETINPPPGVGVAADVIRRTEMSNLLRHHSGIPSWKPLVDSVWVWQAAAVCCGLSVRNHICCFYVFSFVKLDLDCRFSFSTNMVLYAFDEQKQPIIGDEIFSVLFQQLQWVISSVTTTASLPLWDFRCFLQPLSESQHSASSYI